ncbi:MAG TPA: type 1 glutamine amidotransferase domain-containing protein [Chitinophagaceae bacterium]|jgi:putative intracellular protease/amidase|nr:type 1 glutamine amidotransferase domain-containing protein [Chitinophagaceae bacterium]
MKSTKVLFITTSHDKMGDTNDMTGVWLEEIAVPYYLFKEAGADITLASPNGGRVPLDPKSLSVILSTFSTRRFLKDQEAMNFLSNSHPLEEINANNFDVVFLPGGHGPMWDLADNKRLNQLLEAFNNENKPIGAVCHGVVCLLALKNNEGEVLIKGKQLTCFSNSEEELSGLTGIVPFLIETKLLSLGGVYSKGENYVSHVVEDGNIITGQNPASSKEVARKIIALVQHNKFIDKLLQTASN